MDKIKELLGLAPEATDEDVVAAVKALQEQVAAANKEKEEAEADSFAEEHKEVCNKEALKSAYLMNKDAAKALVAGFVKPAAPAPVQLAFVTALNGEESLVQGGCTAIAEDTSTVSFAIGKALANGVALVVCTPSATRSGDGVADGIPVDLALKVNCIERPETNRASADRLTALDAAQAVAHLLDGETVAFASIEQWGDERTRTVTATVTFNISTILTKE